MENLEPELVKKLQISSPTDPKDSFKITTTDAKENLKQKQEIIISGIENANIQAFVEEQMAKFQPPYCDNCPKRRADRVCINKKCGNKYMELICGKCHFDAHKDAQGKPEIDIQEYFSKLATFLYSQKKKKGQQYEVRIDVKNFSSVFNVIEVIRQRLDNFKSKLTNKIESYQSPSEIHSILENGIDNALTKCDGENIQNQLNIIKKRIHFSNNMFFTNDASMKLETFQKDIKELNKYSDTIIKTIAKSFIGYSQIDLSDLKCQNSKSLCSFGFGGVIDPGNIEAKQNIGEITLTNGPGCNIQVYLDYKLEKTKKYKLRFRFDSQPIKYVMVGVMPYSMVENEWVYTIPNQYFSKRFLNDDPNFQCSRIIRGQELNNVLQKGMKIEMRIDFAENYVDFSDYPDYENVNASNQNSKFLSDEPYVLAFAICQTNKITLENFEEIPSVNQH